MTDKEVMCKGIIDMKGQIWLTNVKYLRLSTFHFMGIILMFIVFQSYWYEYRKKYLPNKEYISVH